jgi:predicted RNA-binding Zn ribbon-like protein
MSAVEEIRDFVNTADLEGGTDSLMDDGARAVREAIRILLRANNGIEAADVAGASRTLERAARRADLRAVFVDGGVAFESRDPILSAVARAMADGSWTRLKACRSDTCQWAFVDEARNRSRQWCDMAVCGNRAKAQRFRSRRA